MTENHGFRQWYPMSRSEYTASNVLGRVGLGFDVLGAQLGPPRHFAIFKIQKSLILAPNGGPALSFPFLVSNSDIQIHVISTIISPSLGGQVMFLDFF